MGRFTRRALESAAHCGHDWREYAQDAVALLIAELDGETDVLTGAVRAFLALALAEVGREREAVGVALTALSEYLPPF
jgi:hypothetical protein